MKRIIPSALALVAAVIVSMGGCSKHDLGTAPQLEMKTLGGALRPDSTPNPPHPTPPPDTLVQYLQFVGADSTQAGSTGTSRWLLGNPNKKAFTTTWTLTADPSWPGFPITGTLRLGPSREVPLSVGVPVPASASSGVYTIQMEMVTSPNSTYIVYGQIRVFGNEPPPSPPPTQSAVVFLSADSVTAGGTSQTSWALTNESNHDFTMNWTLSTFNNWPGLPQQGSVALGPNETRSLVVAVAVPDTATAGPRRVDMEVTRPDGLPPQTSNGFIDVLP
jgi:hypothetical protein